MSAGFIVSMLAIIGAIALAFVAIGLACWAWEVGAERFMDALAEAHYRREQRQQKANASASEGGTDE